MSLARLLLPLTLLFYWGASAATCGNKVIKNATDAEAVRSCRVVGDLTISLDGSGEDAPLNINLDGVQVIRGSLRGRVPCGGLFCFHSPQQYTLSSSTLTAIHGNLEIGLGQDKYGLVSLTLPSLQTVGNRFWIWGGHPLTHLDITNLESVTDFALQDCPNLETMLHNGLRNVTHISVQGALKLHSLDSLFNIPVNVSSALALKVPNVQQLVVGFPSVVHLQLGGSMAVTFGSGSTTSMAIEHLAILGNLGRLTRSMALKHLTVDRFILNYAVPALTHLSIPFDQLRLLNIGYTTWLRQLTLPPQAVGYESFALVILDSPYLNLTSEYGVNEQGQSVQTWYWPQKNISTINLDGRVSTEFFKSFLSSENATQGSSQQPRVLDKFKIVSTVPLDCNPFNKLQQEGILPQGADYSCIESSTQVGSSRALHIPSCSTLLGISLGSMIWMALSS